MKSIFISVALFISLAICVTAKDKHKPSEVTSPNKAINVVLRTLNGAPFYSVNRNNQALISDSKFEFAHKAQPALDKDFKIIDSKQSSFIETWTKPLAEVKNSRNQYN